ncbi:DUF262 domain-containing protein [Hydrogenimonas sp.]
MNDHDNYIEIENNEDLDKEEVIIERYDITSYPADYTVKGLVDKLENKQLILPEFQRKFVWNIVKQSRLIESILLGFPIPQLFLYKKPNSSNMLIIDGYQRLQTIKNFLENKLSLSLDDKSPWHGKKYEDLSDDDRSVVDDYVIRSIIIRQIRPNNEHASMFYIFERLNTGGVTLTSMEIRRAVFAGPFLKMLEELNKNPNWQKIIGKRQEDKRFRDVEWILRFFAFYLINYKKYKDPLKTYLNSVMEQYQHQHQDDWKNIFNQTCDKIIRALGEKPFHIPRGRLNLAVLDSVMVAIAKNPTLSIEDIKNKYDELKGDEQYINLVTARDTSKTQILKDRFAMTFLKFGVNI